MTVKHLQQIQRRQLVLAVSLDRSVLEKFNTGFAECATEVQSFINEMEDLDPGLRQRLSHHLDNSVTKLKTASPQSFANMMEPKPQLWTNPLLTTQPHEGLHTSDDLNNNNQRMHVDLVPTRLSTGEIAFVMPNSSNLSFNSASTSLAQQRLFSHHQSNNNNNTSTPRFSAFSVVGNPAKSRISSPPLSPISGDESIRSNNSPMSIYHSTLGNSSLGNITFGTTPSSSPFASTSRIDSGYKSDLNVSDILHKPTVPQQSYTDLFKNCNPKILTGPKSSTSTVSICSTASSSSASSSDKNIADVKDEKEENVWRPW